MHAKLQAFTSSREHVPAPSVHGCLNVFGHGSTTADKSQPILMLLIGAADKDSEACLLCQTAGSEEGFYIPFIQAVHHVQLASSYGLPK